MIRTEDPNWTLTHGQPRRETMALAGSLLFWLEQALLRYCLERGAARAIADI